MTTTAENMAEAKQCPNEMRACITFRNLQHAQNRGTTQDQFAEIHDHFREQELLGTLIRMQLNKEM